MRLPSFVEKLALIAFGIVLSVIIVEGILQVGYLIYDIRSSHEITSRLKEQNTIRIVCIGESTTAGTNTGEAYPTQLEEILNSADTEKKFTVFNKGLCAANSSIIKEQLPILIKETQPDIIISMLGINDTLDIVIKTSRLKGILSYCKTYKLGIILQEHLRHFIKKTCSPGLAEANIDNYETYTALLEEGRRLKEQKLLSDAVQSFKRAALHQPKRATPPLEIGKCLFDMSLYKEAMSYFTQAISLETHNTEARLQFGWASIEVMKYVKAINSFNAILAYDEHNEWAYYGLGICALKLRENDKALRYFLKVIEINPDNERVSYDLKYLYAARGELLKSDSIQLSPNTSDKRNARIDHEIGWFLFNDEQYAEALRYFLKMQNVDGEMQSPKTHTDIAMCYVKLGELDSAISHYKEAIAIDPRFSQSYAGLVHCYRVLGNVQQAELYKKKAKSITASIYNATTTENYRECARIIEQAGIQHICVQYPLLDILPLKTILNSFTSLLFVDNKALFEHAVEEHGYDAIFSDNFAGNFGHCTDKGYRLLAENIAKTILQEFQ